MIATKKVHNVGDCIYKYGRVMWITDIKTYIRIDITSNPIVHDFVGTDDCGKKWGFTIFDIDLD